MKKKVMVVAGTLVVATLLVGQPLAALAADTVQPGQGLGLFRGGLVNYLAEKLNLEQTELWTERQAGKSLGEIAEEHGVEQAQVIQDVVEQRKAIVEQRVYDGTITQEQADYCLTNMESRIQANVERKTVGSANGVRNGQRLGRGTGRATGQGIGPRGFGRGLGMGAVSK